MKFVVVVFVVVGELFAKSLSLGATSDTWTKEGDMAVAG